MNFIDEFCAFRFKEENTTWHLQNLNFTHCLKNTFLIWIPYGFLWVFMPLEIYYIKNSKTRDIPKTLLNTSKMALIIFVAVLSVLDLFHNFQFEDHVFSTYNSLFQFITFMAFFALTWGNIKQGIRSSGILFFFSFLTSICNIPQLCSFIDRMIESKEIKLFINLDSISYILYSISVLVINVMNCFSDPKPKYSYCIPNSNRCPMYEASFLSNVFLLWFQPFIWENRKTPITENLWELDYEDKTVCISKKLEKQLIRNKNKKHGSTEKKFSIFKFLVQMQGIPVVIAILLKIVDGLLLLCFPIIFNLIIKALDNKSPPAVLYLCTFSCGLVSFMDAIFLKKFFFRSYKIQINVRSIVTTLIYKKILKTTDRARHEYTTGELVTLVTTDVDRISEVLPSLTYLFTGPVAFIMSFYFISHILSPQTVISALAIIILLPVSSYLTNYCRKKAQIVIKFKDERGKFIQDFISGIKILKMYAWESSFIKNASFIRDEECKNLINCGRGHATLIFLNLISPSMMSAFSFAIYIFVNQDVMTIGNAFTTIAFFTMIQSPLRRISSFILDLIKVIISLKRIDKFLNLPELNESVVSKDLTDESLIIKDGNFSWKSMEDPPLLRDINIKIEKGALVSVFGLVGSGKSSLISAFLGEMFKISGYVNVNGKTAYVPQQSWIMNATFKENITLGESANEQKYKQILESCSLVEDVATFPAGDQTEIGEKGINLSGGQKQRVGLARAVYCDADIYFFDDSLSAVDLKIGKHIFDNIIGPNGLLNSKTRLFVSHNIQFASQSDYIIIMTEGCIVEFGTSKELADKLEYFSKTSIYINGNINDQKITTNEQSNSSTTTKVENIKNSFDENTQEKKSDGKLIKKENVEIGNVKKRVILFFLKTIGFYTCLVVFILNISHQLFSTASRYWLNIWFSPTRENHENFDKQIQYISIFLILNLGEGITTYVSNLFLLSGIFKAASILQNKLMVAVSRWPLWLLDSTPVGRIMNRFIIDINIIDNEIGIKSVEFLHYINKFLLIIVICSYIVPSTVVVFMMVLTIAYILQNLYAGLAFQLKRIQANNKGPLSSYIIETVTGLHSIRANGYLDNFVKRSFEKIDAYSSHVFPTVVIDRWLYIRLHTMSGFTVSFLIFFILLQRDYLSKEILIFTMSFAIQWTKEFAWCLSRLTELEIAVVAIERINQYINFPQESNHKTVDVSPNWPHNGEIVFQNYKLRYREESELVLKGISFSVKSGEKIGIIGRTGAGKSSLILGILRMVEPAGGNIFIDNVDITQIKLKLLRSRLTLLPQDSVSFMGSLRFNLDPTDQCTTESLWDVLEKSYLKNFVQTLPGGLDYIIEEGGENISCGQRQLICLARALLRKTKILILDEATASIDLETDELIQKTIRNEFKDCTVLTIAHRLNTIQDYDRILVMNDGMVVEFDTPGILMKRKSSIFYDIMSKAGLIS